MKAIDLLREMINDADLAEHGDLLPISADHTITKWFGEDAKLVAGSITIDQFESTYYVQWESVDKTYGFPAQHPADAVIRTETDTIYLWRIEG